MLLVFDRVYIESIDDLNYKVIEEKTKKEGKNKGSKYFDTVGYFGKFEHAVKSVKELATKRKLKNGTNEVIDTLEAINKLIKENK